MENFPQWTSEINERVVPGEDQLGVEGAAQGYQQDILPGIITVTDHARYYSFYAWILYRFITGKNSTKLIKDFRGLFFKRHEMALILSAYLHHLNGKPFGGVVGSGANNSKVRNFWKSEEIASLEQDYFQNTLGGFGQYYRTAMQNMDLLIDAEKLSWAYRLTERGRILAEAYETSISETNYFEKLSKNNYLKEITKVDAQEYAQVGCLCSDALNQGLDRQFLLETFFRFDLPQDINNKHVRRRNSLGVALDLIFQADDEFTTEMLSPALYLNEFYPKKKYNPSAVLLEWVKRWQMVEVRHLFTFGLQCLWASFLIELRLKIKIDRQQWLLWLIEQLNTINWNITVTQLGENLCSEAKIFGKFYELTESKLEKINLESGLDEFTLFQNAEKNRDNPIVLFQTGIRVLLQLYMRFYKVYKLQGQIWNEMAQRQRISINSYFESITNFLETPNFSVIDWVNWMYQELIFEQHEMMALEKMRYQGYDTFKFYYEDNTFHWPTGKEPYREPIRLAANRLNNCISMLIDLGLVNEEDDKTLRLSTEGKEYHSRVIEGLRNA